MRFPQIISVGVALALLTAACGSSPTPEAAEAQTTQTTTTAVVADIADEQTPEPVDLSVQETPNPLALETLSELVTNNPEIFVGYYLDNGVPAVRTSPDADLASAQAMAEAIPDLNFTITPCTRSREELEAIRANIIEFSSQVEPLGGAAYGIDAETCTVSIRTVLSPEQQEQYVAEFGDSVNLDEVTTDPDTTITRGVPVPDE